MNLYEKKLLVIGAAIAAAGLLGYGGYRYSNLYTQNIFLKKQVTEFERATVQFHDSLASTTASLETAREDYARMLKILQAEQIKNSTFEATIKDISGTVSTLKKLSETDPELLKKYSKVYFLNENYAPKQLSSIDDQYLFNKSKSQLAHSGVLPYLTGMMETAKRDGVTLQILSAYRSFYEQASVKTGYEIIYGAGTANQFSAEQGYSEHQLGTTMDFTDSESKGVFSAFEKSAGHAWLTQNAFRYGFVLSYPKDNVYYTYEPWHWRFVGVGLATALHNKNDYFYNWAQGEIDQYLISIFD